MLRMFYLRTDFYGAVTDGGSFTMQKGIVAGLVEQGVHVEVVTSCPPPDHGNVPVHMIPYGRLLMNLPEVFSIAHNSRVVRYIAPLIKRVEPEVIYQRHSSHNITGAMIRRSYQVPYILQFDGSEVWMKTYWSKTYLPRRLQWAEEIALGCAAMITVVSEPMRHIAIECGAEPERVVVVPNGVDVRAFSPDVPPHPLRSERQWNDAVVVGFVGTFDRWHGADVLAEALARAIRKDSRIRGLFVGSGATLETVIKIVHDRGIADRVMFTGRITHEHIPRYLAACDIVTVPTLPNPDGTAFFGSPTKLFEYLAMGKAIIASPLGQVAEIIRDGDNGVWCIPGSVESLADRILELAHDQQKRQLIGQRARQDAVEHHSWSVRARLLLDAWKKLCASKSR